MDRILRGLPLFLIAVVLTSFCWVPAYSYEGAHEVREDGQSSKSPALQSPGDHLEAWLNEVATWDSEENRIILHHKIIAKEKPQMGLFLEMLVEPVGQKARGALQFRDWNSVQQYAGFLRKFSDEKDIAKELGHLRSKFMDVNDDDDMEDDDDDDWAPRKKRRKRGNRKERRKEWDRRGDGPEGAPMERIGRALRSLRALAQRLERFEQRLNRLEKGLRRGHEGKRNKKHKKRNKDGKWDKKGKKKHKWEKKHKKKSQKNRNRKKSGRDKLRSGLRKFLRRVLRNRLEKSELGPSLEKLRDLLGNRLEDLQGDNEGLSELRREMGQRAEEFMDSDEGRELQEKAMDFMLSPEGQRLQRRFGDFMESERGRNLIDRARKRAQNFLNGREPHIKGKSKGKSKGSHPKAKKKRKIYSEAF